VCVCVCVCVCVKTNSTPSILTPVRHSYSNIMLLVSFLLGSYVGKSDDSEELLVPAALNASARIRRTRSKASSGDGRRFDLNSTTGQPPR